MVSTNEVELVNYFIFNPRFGNSEGEEEKKILYYYPHKTKKDIQLKNAGLCEALIKFTESFNPDKPCHSFETEKTKQFLFEAEPDFWVVMTVSIPHLRNNHSDHQNGQISPTLSENVYEAILRKSYRMYKIFCNSFSSTLEDLSEKKLDILKDKLNNFYDNVGLKYLSNLKVANCDILDVFQGICFLPLGKEPFLHVQSFINLVETKFKPVKYSVFLYNDQLVWSGIHSEDMQMIYQYLVLTLLPSHLDLELQGGSLPRGSTSSVHHYGSFVTGPSNLKDSIVSTGKVPKVYLKSDGEDAEVFHLVVYKALSATLCLFIHEEEPLTLELFKNLDSFLGPHLTTVVSEISEHCAKYTSVTTTVGENGPKVLYFNRLNLAQKSTMHVQNRRHVTTSVPVDTLRMIEDLNAEQSGLNECREVMMLTLNDCWLVGRFSNFREFYVIFNQKKGIILPLSPSLMEVADEVKKLCDSQLKGIFFAE